MSSNKDLSEIAFCPHCVDLKRPLGSFFIAFAYPYQKNPQLTFLCSGDSYIPICLSPSALYTPILSHFKDDVKEVKAVYECCMVFDGFNDIAEFDIVEADKMVEVPR